MGYVDRPRFLLGVAMVPGPLLPVEMVTTVRRGRYFGLRMLYAGILLFVLWTTYSSTLASSTNWDGTISIEQGARAATYFFYQFSWVQLVALLLVAPAMTATTVASERERRTIEYLFCTDLSNAEIVVAKALARLLLIAKFMLVGIPILYLFRLLGGIPSAALVGSCLIAASTALLLASLSVCLSVTTARARDAVVRVYFFLMAMLLVPIMLMPFLAIGPGRYWWVGWVAPPIRWLLSINPLVVLGSALGSQSAVGVALDWGQIRTMVGWHVLLSVVSVGSATALVRRVHLRDASQGEPEAPGSRRWRAVRLPRWRPPMGERPILWKEAFSPAARSRLGWVGRLAALLLSAGAIGWSLVMYYVSVGLNTGRRGESYFLFLACIEVVVACVLLLTLAARSATSITYERERDTWNSLLATPLTGAEIVQGKVLGLLYHCRGGLVVLALVAFPGLLVDASVILNLAVTWSVLVVIGGFVSCLGVYFSLLADTGMKALAWTMGTLLLVGGGYLMCCCPLVFMGGRGEDGMLMGLAPLIPFLLAAPTLVAGDASQLSNNAGYLLGAFCLGVAGYLVTASLLYRAAVAQFDQKSGRSGSLDGPGLQLPEDLASPGDGGEARLRPGM
jgi:ABC-type transport system involved in multi-copper enzyme maturation permease subunit